ncbi:MAG: type II toxin-antitoxin system RelE/ParE family toxin [Bacteroidia bacterium]|jgi:plasmid stabilization system protein ParE
MDSEYKLFWTDEAIRNLENILNYLNERWTQREIDNFKERLTRQIRIIRQSPNIFPVSLYNPRLRKAVLSKQTTVFYEVSGQIIYLVYLFNSKQDIEQIN